MKAKTWGAAVLAVLTTVMLVSCDELFDTNVFKSAGLGQISSSELKTETAGELYSSAYTSDGALSETFIETLASDEEAKAAVLETLSNGETATDPTTAQGSAVLKADIQLETSGASETVSNMTGYLASASSLPSTSEEISSFFSAVIPATIMNDTAALTAMIDSLLTSAADYQVVEASLNAGTGNNVLAPSTYNTIVQSAVVATALSQITINGTAATTSEIVAALQSGDASTMTFPSVDSLNSSLSGILGASGYGSISDLIGSSSGSGSN